jgi:hypothetical protein
MASTPPTEGLPDDPFAGERFIRVVGRRRRPDVGGVPTAEARAAMASLLGLRRTGAPNGVFVYRSHEVAKPDRDNWVAEAINDEKKAAPEDARHPAVGVKANSMTRKIDEP